MVTETRNKSAEFFKKENHVKVPKNYLTKSEVIYNPPSPPTGPSISSAGSLDVSTFQVGTEHTITTGTAVPTGGGSVTYEYRWLVAGVSDATTAAYTPQEADIGETIAAQWRAVESGGTNDGATNWQTVGSGVVAPSEWQITDNGDGTFDIVSAPPAPPAVTVIDNGDGTFDVVE